MVSQSIAGTLVKKLLAISPSKMKTVKSHSKFFIIGNAAEQHPITEEIKSDDIVVRFNIPNPSCSLKADWTFIANGYTQIRHLKIDHQLFKADMQIFFRYSKQDIWFSRYQKIPLHKRIKYCWRFPQWIKKFNLNQYHINTIPCDVYQHCVNILGFRQPSTGLLAIDFILQNYPKHEVLIHNFTNEGWTGHNWDDEKKIMQTWISTKRLKIV